MNPNITWEIVQSNPGLPWSYEYLSMNSNITLETVQSNPGLPWSDFHIAANINLCPEKISEIFKYPINLDLLCGNSLPQVKRIWKKNIICYCSSVIKLYTK